MRVARTHAMHARTHARACIRGNERTMRERKLCSAFKKTLLAFGCACDAAACDARLYARDDM